MRGKGLWLSIKSTFAPTEVAASLALIVLVITFTLVYFGARHRPSAATHSAPVAVSESSPVPEVSPVPSADRSPVAQRAATNNGLGTVIRAAVATTRRRGSGPPASPGTPSPTDAASPSPSDTAPPTPSPSDTPAPTPDPSDIPTPTPSAIDIPSPLPSPS